ncbi:hypothetical protein FHS42_003929 [Streptomyces zagrosensis]|uniref:Metal-dependent phosphohydrolase n=1 Tax=Streptomyces zagrosensis TaxID=1042984 RepID=A0A7W9QCV0_9ACTN|nr:hypothetical protein [Streptomyces zagrosensis]
MRALPRATRVSILGAVSAATICGLPILTAGPATAFISGPATTFLSSSAMTFVWGPAVLPVTSDAAAWLPVVLLALVFAGCQEVSRRAAYGTGRAATVDGPPPEWGSPVLLAGAFLLPPAAAALVPVPGALIGRGEQRPMSVSRAGDVVRLSLASYAGATAFAALDGPAAVVAADVPHALLPAAVAALACCLVVVVLDRGAMGTTGRSKPRTAWSTWLVRSCAPHLLHGLAGLTMAVLWRSPYGPPAALLVLLPIAVSCWALAQCYRERAAHQATVRALVQAVDLKDRYTRGHGERVGRAAVLIARELGMAEERLETLRIAGVLHDVGKLGVPTRLLRKNGPLTPQERSVIELHPEHGDAMVRGIGFLDEARSAILHHHERLDGSGYPHGLAGYEIPEAARVVAVADAFDAMTSTRSYRRARPVAAAVEELRRCAGSQFDPRMVRALARALARHGWQPETAADGIEYDAAGPHGGAIDSGCAYLASGAAYGPADHRAHGSAYDRVREGAYGRTYEGTCGDAYESVLHGVVNGGGAPESLRGGAGEGGHRGAAEGAYGAAYASGVHGRGYAEEGEGNRAQGDMTGRREAYGCADTGATAEPDVRPVASSEPKGASDRKGQGDARRSKGVRGSKASGVLGVPGDVPFPRSDDLRSVPAPAHAARPPRGEEHG